MNDLADHVDVEYKAWANREQVIGEHLRTLYDAQKALSGIVAAERLGAKKTAVGQAWWEFYQNVSKLYQQALPKIRKMKDLYDKKSANEKEKDTKKRKIHLNYDDTLKVVKRASDYLFTGEGTEILAVEHRDAIELISLLYDSMGYSEAERKVTRTPFLSDVQPKTEETEGEEMASID